MANSGTGRFRADLHVHTHYSYDSFASPERIFLKAKRAGLSAVAVTDHNTTRGWKPMLEASKRNGIPVILGEEIRVAVHGIDSGEILGLFLNAQVRKSEPMDVMDEIRSQGGLIVFPHPFDTLRQSIVSPERYARRAHAAETLNARTDAATNAKAAAFAERFRLAKTGGSDAHSAMEVGTAWTEADAADVEGFRKAMERAKTRTGGVTSSPFVHAFSTLAKMRPWKP